MVPAPAPSKTGTSAKTSGYTPVLSVRAGRTTAASNAIGPTISAHAHCLPRTSARAAPGVRSVCQTAEPSRPYRLLTCIAAKTTIHSADTDNPPTPPPCVSENAGSSRPMTIEVISSVRRWASRHHIANSLPMTAPIGLSGSRLRRTARPSWRPLRRGPAVAAAVVRRRTSNRDQTATSTASSTASATNHAVACPQSCSAAAATAFGPHPLGRACSTVANAGEVWPMMIGPSCSTAARAGR